MKKIITIISLAIGSISVFAQQDPQFSQFMHNKLFMNPAYAGMKGAYCFTAIGRQQWSGFDGAPRSGVFSADLATPNLGGGIGLNVMFDQLGFESNVRYDLNYSYHVSNIYRGTLGIGIDIGAFSKRIGPTGNNQWLATSNWMSDQTIPPSLKTTAFDMGLGLWYERKDVWFGISSTHLNSKLLDEGQTLAPDNSTHNRRFQMARHYFITGGYNIHPESAWEIQPSFLIKSDATITSFDLNLTALFNQRFWFGASYRFKDAICPMVGFQWSNDKPAIYEEATDDAPRKLVQEAKPGNTLKVGFAYDYTTSNLRNYNNGTFEIFLNYCIPMNVRATATTRVWDTRDGPW